MTKEFKKISNSKEIRYVLETASAGATGASAVAAVTAPLGGVRKRTEDTIKVPVQQKPRQGPLKPQTGGGKHRDKKKEMKSGKEKHRKPFAEQGMAEGMDSISFWKREAQKAGGAANIDWYRIGVEHGKQGIVMNPPYGVGGKAVTMYSKGLDAGEQGVAEGLDGEYDDEAGMADNNLETLKRAVDGLDNLINTGDNLPEWCQEKIAVAKSMLVAVWDYMQSEEHSEHDMAEGLKDPKDNPCWKGYHPVGTKKKGGRTVPNCVPNANEDSYVQELAQRLESAINEKAVSKAQQRFMGMVHAVQKGDMPAPSKAVAKAAKGMSMKAGHDYAATKHKGLPEKKSKK